MKRIIPSLFFILVCTLLPTQGASAVDLSDTVNPIVSIKVLNEPQLGSDFASFEITYKDDKNLFRARGSCDDALCLVPDLVQDVIAKDASPACRAFQFYSANPSGLNLLTAAEDLTKRVQNASGVQQVFNLRFSTKLLRIDNGCKYETRPLQFVWWVNPFDIYKGIEKFGDAAGNGAYVIGELPRLGDYGTPAVVFPVTAAVKITKSYCDFFAEDKPNPIYQGRGCILKNYSKIYKAPTFYQLNLSDLQKAGLFNAVKTSAKDLGDFSDLTYSFNSFNTNVSENVRLIADTSMMLSNPNFPSYKSTKIEDAIFRKAAYEKVEKLADLSQDVDLIAVWNEWVAKSNTDKAAADKAAAEVKAAADKAAAEVKAAADKAAATKKSTITCTKGKLTKKVTAAKPKCPTGYKKVA